MTEEQEYKVICHCVGILATMCAADETKIIEILTGYLWDEEEAGSIKRILADTPRAAKEG